MGDQDEPESLTRRDRKPSKFIVTFSVVVVGIHLLLVDLPPFNKLCSILHNVLMLMAINIHSIYQNLECWSYEVMLKAGCQELQDRRERTT